MSVKRMLWKALITSGLWPHVNFSYSPFKVLEFKAMVEDLLWTGDERVLDIGCGEGLQTLLLVFR